MDNQQRSYSESWKICLQNSMYEISDHGNVRFTKDHKQKYKSVDANGYVIIQFKINMKRITKKVHRLVAELFLEPPSQELIDKCKQEHWGEVLVKHLDNNKQNNHFTNLQWSDLLGNTKQAWDDKLIVGLSGESNGRAVLTEALVKELCAAFEAGMMPKEATEKFGVSRQQAGKIRAGIQWKHVWCKYNISVNRRVPRSTTIENTQ